MEIQNFHNKEGAWVPFFHFTKNEMTALRNMANAEIKKRQKAIEHLKNHPENEGQVYWESAIEEQNNIIIMLKDLTENGKNKIRQSLSS